MAEYALRYRSRISRRSAHDMIMLLAMHSNHNQPDRFRAEADVKRAFERNGVDYARLVEQCRDWPEPVPFFENFLGSTWTAGSGVTASRVDQATGQEDCQVEGPGTLTLLGYWATFESAHRSLTRAVELASYSELQSAIVDGIASIEGYVGHRVEIWNRQHPEDQLVDTKLQKVRFEEKLDLWLPKMTGGKKLSKGDESWRALVALQNIRDDVRVHPKASGYGISLIELAGLIDMFKAGIATMLIRLHLLFGERVPRVVIRAAYAPDVEVVELGSLEPQK